MLRANLSPNTANRAQTFPLALCNKPMIDLLSLLALQLPLMLNKTDYI